MNFPLGHRPLGKRPNVRREASRVKRNPLEPWFTAMQFDLDPVASSDVSRYLDAYKLYYLSVRRYLTNMSIVARYMSSAYYARKYRRKYSPPEKAIAEKYREVAPYTELEIINCLIHARILLDRVTSLSSHFLRVGNRPSFKSFNDHKRFFKKLTAPYGDHEPYAEHIRDETAWFEMPLKAVRDDFVVHSAPKHMRFVALPNDFEVELLILRADGIPPEKPFANATPIRVNILRMSYDIEKFLQWYCNYAISKQPSKC
ncbi:hypothetical protein GJ699_00190 [Duganella sp. FT80W]|uniref:Uncharacterized protein n=1 Tax=Duganella guangzhouensis TaxID=2666084 RepID=A0A6I2KST6_9BURK|nr:hypothetical protein [Duganella guangzhouensis]MRW88402.1 hypothetical protein [Duganella guangzhouensis]